MIRYWSR
nr:Ycf15 [Victoria cruziana]